MAKKLLFGEDARKAIKSGIDQVANAVKTTLGPRGRNGALDKGWGGPTITNDGVSIAREITLPDKFENMGAEIAKEVASKTNDGAGDGTTTSVVLLQALVEEGMKHMRNGMDAMGLRAGIEAAAAEGVELLKKIAKTVKTVEELRHVATISAENEELGKLVADTIQEIGKEGIITTEESPTLGLSVDRVEGLQFDRGYHSPYFVTDTNRMEAVFKDAYILICDKKITNIQDLVPLLERVATASKKKELVIITEEIDQGSMSAFVVNKLRGSYQVLAVKAPSFGDKRKRMLEDIAVLTGGTVISDAAGMKFEEVQAEQLGRAERVLATKDTTLIVGGKGQKKDIDAHKDSLRTQLKDTSEKYEQEALEERIAALSGGVAVLRVGAATETEMKYLKLKIEDAINATKAAAAEGIVPGGGIALTRVANLLRAKYSKGDGLKDWTLMPGEFRTGYEVVIAALEMPLKQIAINAGRGDGTAVLERVNASKDGAGYDAKNGEIVPDVFKAGIIDPARVERLALTNAASSAGIFLTTEFAVADEPAPKFSFPGMPSAEEI